MSLMVSCYFAVTLLLIIPAINTNLNRRWTFCLVKCLTYLYLIGKITVLLIMLINVQGGYSDDWSYNTCDSLKGLTLFWLIWNYFLISITFIYGIVFIGSDCCDDNYDSYDFDY